MTTLPTIPLWEYTAIDLHGSYDNATILALNEWGRNGWEVIAFVDRGTTREYLMKRPLQGAVPDPNQRRTYR